MDIDEFQTLATTLITVVGDRRLKRLKKLNKDGSLQGIFVNNKGEDTSVKVVYYPEHNIMKAYTNTSLVGNYVFAESTITQLKKYIEEKTTAADLDKPITTMSELVENIKNGNVQVELHGHFTNQNIDSDFDFPPVAKKLLDKIVYDHQQNIDGAAGKFDGQWESSLKKNDTIEERNKSMRDYYKHSLDNPITHRYYKVLLSSSTSEDCTCSACGKQFELILKDANTLSIAPGYFMRNKNDYNIECEFPKGPPHTEGEINVNGDLVLANFFSALPGDSPKDKEYSDEYRLNYFAGRRNITNWKAKNQNIAYGQMSNMSLSVWTNKNKDHVILTDAWIDESKVKLKKLKSMGFKQVKYKGDEYISLSVWRWEATDVPTLESAAKKKLPAIEKEMKDDYKDIIIIEGAKHGIWEFNHYYDTTPNPEDEDELFIYAELKLKMKK